jgi:hypothetical protein
MKIEQQLPLLESILMQWQEILGTDFEGYKNHCYRMLHFCFFLYDCTDQDKQKLIIAACFHDLGLWTEKTVDYLPPSVLLAKVYLKENNLTHWDKEIGLIIDLHHKVTPYTTKDFPLVEIFRKADLADFSLGLMRGALPSTYVQQVKAVFPNRGFHKMLLKEQLKWFGKHPLNPFPLLKW